MRRLGLVLLVLAIAGCQRPSGEPAKTFVTPAVQHDYIPLQGSVFMIFEGDGAAVAIGNGVAVTNAHNANLLDPKIVLGGSVDYDLLFFHSKKTVADLSAEPPRLGERVIAYGQGEGGSLRMADGVINSLNAPVKARCAKCAVQTAFTFEGNAGPGFSGGPVLDAKDGHLLGIVFGYVDPTDAKSSRTIYAYPMERVFAELELIARNAPQDVD